MGNGVIGEAGEYNRRWKAQCSFKNVPITYCLPLEIDQIAGIPAHQFLLP
jgi:hypothetical protein